VTILDRRELESVDSKFDGCDVTSLRHRSSGRRRSARSSCLVVKTKSTIVEPIVPMPSPHGGRRQGGARTKKKTAEVGGL